MSSLNIPSTKFAIVSDLHLEQFGDVSNIDFSKLLQQDSDCTLIVAGDVTRITPITQDGRGKFLYDPIYTDTLYKAFLAYVSSHFHHVILICGNHEFYSDPDICSFLLKGKDMSECKEMLRSWCEPYANVTLLDNSSIILDGIAIWGGTFWSHLPQHITLNYPIYENGKQITTADYNRLHDEAVKSVKAFKNEHMTKPQIVVSHHAPTFIHFPPHHMASAKKFLYGTDCSELFEDGLVDAWIAGHTHQNYLGPINKTLFICNSDPAKIDFDPSFMFTSKRYDPLKYKRAAMTHSILSHKKTDFTKKQTKQTLISALNDISNKQEYTKQLVDFTTGQTRNRWTDIYNQLENEAVYIKNVFMKAIDVPVKVLIDNTSFKPLTPTDNTNELSNKPKCSKKLEFVC